MVGDSTFMLRVRLAGAVMGLGTGSVRPASSIYLPPSSTRGGRRTLALRHRVINGTALSA